MTTQQTHVQFIQARLPRWLKQAGRGSQERYKTLVQQLQRDSDAFNARVKDLPAPYDFTFQRLQEQPELQGWGPASGMSVADAVRRARVKRGPFVTSPWLPAVKAAMRNYPPAEAASGSDFDKKGQLVIQGKPDQFLLGGEPSDTAVLPTTAASFAQLCRRMDAGGAYRTLLERQFPRIDRQTPAVAAAYVAYARSQLACDAYEAKLDGRLDKTGERLLAHVGVQLEAEPVAPLECEVKSLELVSAPLFGVRIFWGVKGDAKGVRPVVLHMPHDVVAPISQFPSLQAMAAQLTERVRQRSYRESLMRYLPVRLQGELGAALHDQVEWEVKDNLNLFQEIHARVTGWREGERGEDQNSRRIRVPAPRVAWSSGDIRGDHWHSLYHEWRGQTLDNASTVMVSTKDKDWQALLARFEYWEHFAEQALMLAASFIPFCAPIGMGAAAVGGVRLLYEVFEGIQAFNEGHAQEGIEHIFNVLFGVVQGAYLGFIGSAIEPMPVGAGGTRLWNGDVAPFQSRRLPPVEAEQDAWGVWRTANEAWVSVEGRYFEVQGNGASLDLRLPTGHSGVRPPLEWNRTRGWQWAHRNPLQRNNLELLRNFAETPGELDDRSVLAVQRQVGISEEHLRYLQVNGRSMPALFAEALDEAWGWQQVRRTIGRLRKGEPPQDAHFRVVQTLTQLPGWPSDLTLRYHDGLTLHPIGDIADTRSLYLHKSDLAQPAWAERILAGLTTEEQRAILGQGSIGLSAAQRSQLLAGHWAGYLEHNTTRVTAAMARASALDPLAAPLVRDFPGLPDAVANEIAHQSVGQDRLRLQLGRLTENLSQQCVEALRERRVSRALRALERGEGSVDRDCIVMALLANAPWLRGRARLRLMLRGRTIPLEAGETGPLKIIRQEGEQYSAFDEQGNELADGLYLEDALLKAMPDDARQALGLNIWEGSTLRSQLLAQALADRQSLRGYLMIQRRDGAAAGLQRVNGQWGYPASGRGQLPLHSWRATLDARLERLFPSHAGPGLVGLRATLAAQAARQHISLESLVIRLDNEWSALDDGLRQWVNHEGVHHPAEDVGDPNARGLLRQQVAQRIRRAWQRQPEPGREGSELQLRLSDCLIGRLPPLSASFDHVETLNLARMGLDEDPSDFLRCFPNIDILHLHGNRLTGLPVAVGELGTLLELSIGDNPLQMNADVFAPLLDAEPPTPLRTLHLSQISSGAQPAASANLVAAINRLAELHSLRELVWTDNVNFTPQELQAITALPRLQVLDLVRCGLRLDEEGSAFLRTATHLEDLRLSGNQCNRLPNLPELTELRDLELADAGLDRVPELALTVVSRPSTEMIYVDLRNNRIATIQADLLPRLGEPSRPEALGIILDNNPLPSAQIQALRALEPTAFRYTADGWLDAYPSFQRTLEQARDNAGDRRFIDWFSGAMHDADTRTGFGLAYNDGLRAAGILQHYTGYRNIHAELAARLPDLDAQLAELRGRLQARVLDRVHPDITELELHFSMFGAVQRARLVAQNPAFSSFLSEHYDYWNHALTARYPAAGERQGLMTQARFVEWLSDAQDGFNSNDQTPRAGEMTWRPYLGLMSRDWTEGLAVWDTVENDLVDAFSQAVNPSGWPQALLDNLADPDADLPSAWEQVPENGQMVWRRATLEAVADVDWAAGLPVTLTEDQFRRTMVIYRSVKSRELEYLVWRVTSNLVGPWWPLRPPFSAA